MTNAEKKLDYYDRINFNTKVEDPMGAYRLALGVVQQAIHLPNYGWEEKYRRNKIFLMEGKLLPMVADCMEYDLAKLRASMLEKLEKNYEIMKSRVTV